MGKLVVIGILVVLIVGIVDVVMIGVWDIVVWVEKGRFVIWGKTGVWTGVVGIFGIWRFWIGKVVVETIVDWGFMVVVLVTVVVVVVGLKLVDELEVVVVFVVEAPFGAAHGNVNP